MKNITKKILILTLLTTMLLAPAITIFQVNADIPPPNWDVTGSYLIDVTAVDDPNTYEEQLILVQEGSEITGSIALVDPEGGSKWIIDEGFVSGDDIEFGAYYDTNPTMQLVFIGTINSEGFISGTWADVSPGTRLGNLQVTQGNAQLIIISLTLDGSPLPATIQILTEGELPVCIPPLPLGIAGEFTPYIDVTILDIFDGTVTVKVYYDDTFEGEEFEETLKLYMGDCVDFNLDGTINGKDLAIIKKAIESGTPDLVPFDVDNNGVVNEVDVDIVKEYMTKGLIVNQLDVEDERSQVRLPWLDITFEVHADENYILGETDHFSIFRGR